GVKPKPLVGVGGIEALLLQPVGAKLVDQPNAAAFLREIEKDAAARLVNRFERTAKLLPAVAFQRADQIAGKAFRMQPREDGRAPVRVTNDDGKMLDAAVLGAKGVDGCILRRLKRHFRRGNLLQAERRRLLEQQNIRNVEPD